MNLSHEIKYCFSTLNDFQGINHTYVILLTPHAVKVLFQSSVLLINKKVYAHLMTITKCAHYFSTTMAY